MTAAVLTSNAPLTIDFAKKVPPLAVTVPVAIIAYLVAAVFVPSSHVAPEIVDLPRAPATPAPVVEQPVVRLKPEIIYEPVVVRVIAPPVRHHLVEHVRHAQKSGCECVCEPKIARVTRVADELPTFIRPGKAPPLTVSHFFENLFRNLFSARRG